MTYSIIGILSSILLLIINRDVLWGRGEGIPVRTRHNYRLFLMGMLTYLLQAGMNAHLSKPVEPEVLFAALEESLRTKG